MSTTNAVGSPPTNRSSAEPLANEVAVAGVSLDGTKRQASFARLWWVVLSVLSLSLYGVRQVADGAYGKDFTIFLTGAHLLVGGQLGSLYDLGVQADVQRLLAGPVVFPGGVLPFNYPPIVATFFSPLVLLSPGSSYYVWVAVQWILLIAWSVWVVFSLRRWGAAPPKLFPLVLLSFPPLLESVLMGQTSVLLLVLWWWALTSMRSGRWIQIGLAVSLAAFKPQMVLLLVVALLALRCWQSLAVVTLSQALMWGLAVITGGIGVITAYVDMLLLSARTVGTLGFYPIAMQNLRGLLVNVAIPVEWATAIALASWLLSLFGVYLLWRRPWPLDVRFGLTAVVAVLLSPHTYVHDASLLLLAVVCSVSATSGLLPGVRNYQVDLRAYLLPFSAVLFGIYAVVLRLVVWSYLSLTLAVWTFGVVAVVLLCRQRRDPVRS